MFRQEHHYPHLVVGKVCQFPREIGMDGDCRLAGQPEGGGQRNGHHIARVAHVVSGNPFPEPQLVLVHNGVDVENRQHIFYRIVRHLLVHTPHHGAVQPLGAELHHHALPHADGIVILLRHTVGIGVVDVKWQYDVDKKSFHFQPAKVRKFSFLRYF